MVLPDKGELVMEARQQRGFHEVKIAGFGAPSRALPEAELAISVSRHNGPISLSAPEAKPDSSETPRMPRSFLGQPSPAARST
jgi:hypothetical protein